MHLCEYKFTLKLHLNPSPLVTSLLLLLVLSVAVAHLTFFAVTLKSPFYVNNQFIWCEAFLPQIQAAFIDSLLQCSLHHSPAELAHRVSSENAAEPEVVLSFLRTPAVPRNNPFGGTSGKLHPTACWWELGSLDPALRHNLTAEQIVSTFKSLDIKPNGEILK